MLASIREKVRLAASLALTRYQTTHTFFAWVRVWSGIASGGVPCYGLQPPRSL